MMNKNTNTLNQKISVSDINDLAMIRTNLHDNNRDSLISILYNLANIFHRHHINEDTFEPAGQNYITSSDFIIAQYHHHQDDQNCQQEYRVVKQQSRNYFWFIGQNNQIFPLNVNNLTKLVNDTVAYLYRIRHFFA